MAFDFKKDTLTSRTTAGTQAITTGFAPKAVIFWTSQQSGTGQNLDIRFSLGFASGSSTAEQRVIGWAAEDNESTSNSRRWGVSGIVETKTADNAILLHANVDSFDANGFTLDWTAVLGIGQVVHYIALGGSDLLNALVKEEVSTTTTGNQQFPAYGFIPDSVMLLCPQLTAIGNLPNIQVGVGAATGTVNRWSYCFTARDGQTMANMQDRRAGLFNTRCLVGANVTNGSADFEDDFVSFDDLGGGDGTWTIDHINAHSQANVIFVLALEFSADGGVTVDNFNKNGNVGPDTQPVTGVGFQPIGLMFFDVDLAHVNNTFAEDDEEQSVGGGGETTIVQGATWTGGDNEVIPTEENRSNLTTRVIQQRRAEDQTVAWEGNLDSLDTDGFTITWDPATNTIATIFYIAFKEVAEVLGPPEFMTAIRPGIQREVTISILSEEEQQKEREAIVAWLTPTYPIKRYEHITPAGSLTYVGDITKQTNKVLDGALTYIGDIVKKTDKILDGNLSFVGDLTTVLQLFVVKIMSAIRPGISRPVQIVSITRREKRKQEEYVSIYTRMKRLVRVTTITNLLTVSGVLSFTGDITKQTNKVISGSLTFVGDIIKKTKKPLTGSLTFLGDIVKKTKKVLDGGLTFVGDFVSKLDAVTFRMAAIRPGIERVKTIVTMVRGDERLEESYVSWFTRMHRLVRNVFFPISLAGTLSFTGDILKKTKKVLSGNLTYVGDITKKTIKVLSGILSFVGGISTKLDAVVFRMAAIRPAIARSSVIVNISRGLEKKRVEEFAWWFANFLRRLTRKPTQTFILSVAGTLTFIGDITKKTLKQLAGGLTFVGDITKKTSKILSGILSFTGDLATKLDAIFMRMAAIRPGIQRVISIVNIAQEQLKREKEAFVSWFSTPRRLVRRAVFFLIVSGILSVSGIITKKVSKQLSGTLSFVGDIIKKTSKILSGSLTFVGDIQTKFLDFIAKIMAAIRPGIERGATISIIGKEKEKKEVGYGWWFANSLRRLVRKPTETFLLFVAGILSFVGDIQKQTNKQLSGSLTSLGDISKKTLKVLSGILSSVGDLVTKVDAVVFRMAAIIPGIKRSATISGIAKQKELEEQEAFISWFTRMHRLVRSLAQTFLLSVAGTLTFVGTISKVTKKQLSGSLTFIGTIVKKTLKQLSGSLSFIGTLVTKFTQSLIVAGSLTFTGLITKKTSKQLAGILSVTGTITKLTKKILSGILSFVGDIDAFITGLPTTLGIVKLKARGAFIRFRTKSSKFKFKK